MRAPLFTLGLVISGLAATALGGCGDAPPTPPPVLPFELPRAPAGEVVSDAERTEVTRLYLEVLSRTNYLRYISDRAHGWPEEPSFATWWSGVRVVRTGTTVTFDHPPDGSDNNGLRTAPMLEAACYAYALWKDPADAALIRSFIRGFSAWIEAMERTSAPDAPVMLTRAFYPPAVRTTRGPLALVIDYSDQRPGLDNGATGYVHLPDNPKWGDIWVKNKRSKDDIGHMLRAMAALDACRPAFDAATAADDRAMLEHYRAWARQVEDDDFRIATWDKDLAKWIPEESLAIFVQLLDTECDAMLSLRMMGRGDTGGRDCKNGVNDADEIASALNDHARHIFLSFHAAAVHLALQLGLTDTARTLASGLALRSDKVLDLLARGETPPHFDESDFAGELAHAANAGVPLTWREVRALHQAIRQAHTYYLDPARHFERDPFAAGAADGEYPMEPGSAGFNFRELGVLLGACASATRNTAGAAPLDCALVSAR